MCHGSKPGRILAPLPDAWPPPAAGHPARAHPPLSGAVGGYVTPTPLILGLHPPLCECWLGVTGRFRGWVPTHTSLGGSCKGIQHRGGASDAGISHPSYPRLRCSQYSCHRASQRFIRSQTRKSVISSFCGSIPGISYPAGCPRIPVSPVHMPHVTHMGPAHKSPNS